MELAVAEVLLGLDVALDREAAVGVGLPFLRAFQASKFLPSNRTMASDGAELFSPGVTTVGSGQTMGKT